MSLEAYAAAEHVVDAGHAQGLCPVPNIRIFNPPLPGVEMSPQMFWHRRTDADPLQIWLRAAICDIAAGKFDRSKSALAGRSSGNCDRQYQH
jgi:hypothetical protein